MKKLLLLLVPLTGLLLACQPDKKDAIDPTLKEWRVAYEANAMLEPGTHSFNGGRVMFPAKAGDTVYSNGELFYGGSANSKIYVKICQKQTRRNCGYVMYGTLSGFDIVKDGK